MRVHCFHGFLGNENEFDFLKKDFDIQTYDMAKLCSGTREEAFSRLDISPDDALVGYSFGARFALEAMKRFDCKALVMLAGHAGLEVSKKAQRLKIEDAFVQKVEELSFDSFVEYWNGIGLFAYDGPISPKPVDKAVMVNMFREFALSKQPLLIDFVQDNANKILWICGEKDTKYRDYTKENIEPLGVECRYVDAGHRLLKRPETIFKLIKSKLEEI